MDCVCRITIFVVVSGVTIFDINIRIRRGAPLPHTSLSGRLGREGDLLLVVTDVAIYID